MPLIKSASKEAIGKNIKKEMDAGKPQKQSIAIAFSVQRAARKKKKANYDVGGAVRSPLSQEGEDQEVQDQIKHPSEPYSHQEEEVMPFDVHLGENKAKGGVIDNPKLHESEEEMPHDDRKALAMAMLAKKRKKMAYGGAAEDDGNPGLPKAKPDDHRLDEDDYMSGEWAGGPDPIRKPDDERLSMDDYMADHFGEGDDVENRSMSIAKAIMRKQHMSKMMADGGMVDIDENAKEQPNEYYHENEDAALKENYDSDMDGISQPLDSNEHGDKLSDEDEHDRVEQIRKKLIKKRGM